jgi:hypothetical protein
MAARPVAAVAVAQAALPAVAVARARPVAAARAGADVSSLAKWGPAWLAALGLWVGGCQPARSPESAREEKARQLSAVECRDGSPEARAQRLHALRTVVAADAMYPERPNKPLRASPAIGVRMAVAASDNVAPVFLEHEIECHEADVVLGRTPLTDDDPFVLPAEWVDARVEASGTQLVIELRPASGGAATEVVDRARRFADARR